MNENERAVYRPPCIDYKMIRAAKNRHIKQQVQEQHKWKHTDVIALEIKSWKHEQKMSSAVGSAGEPRRQACAIPALALV